MQQGLADLLAPTQFHSLESLDRTSMHMLETLAALILSEALLS